MSKVILHLESRNSGGAHDYTYNIHCNMVSAGYRSYIAIYGSKLITPEGNEVEIKKNQIPFRERIKRKIHNIYMNETKPYVNPKYCAANLRERITQFNAQDLFAVLPENPDYIFVHWASGFATAKYVYELQRLTGAKVYYIMIDEAILSGACHYPWDCDRYQSGCKDCPMTESRFLKFLIRRNFLFKQRYLVKDKNVIYPTSFDLQRLKRSLLWKDAKTYLLLESIDESLFCPNQNQEELRNMFNIPVGKKVIFFGCSDLNEERKGMRQLIEALNLIERNDVVLLAAGRDTLPKMKHPSVFTGHLNMATLAQAYKIADVFVCPSLEDSGPQMINMSIMSGTPVVAFEMGVALDIVITGKTGYRAHFNDAVDMAKGINYILDLKVEEYQLIKQQCREMAVDLFSRKSQLDFFHNLFNQENNDILS